MSIPPLFRESFFAHMGQHDDQSLGLKEWLAAMLEAAEGFLVVNGLDEEPRAAVVYYCKRLSLRGFEDE